MEEPQLSHVEENSERARYLAELSSMLEEMKPQTSGGVFKVEHKIGGGLKSHEELRSSIQPEHTVLDEQKHPLLLEDELLPPTSEVDFLAFEKVRKNIPKYLQPREDYSSSVKKYNFPVAKKPAVSNAVETKEEFKFRDIETAIINFLRGRALSKDEIINLVSDHKDEISPEEHRTRVTIGGVIEDLLNRKRLVANREGKLSVVIAGGSTNFPEEENLPNQKWSLPTTVINEFDEILANEHNPVQRKKLIAFHTFMDVAISPDDLEKRILEAKKRGVFDTVQCDKLVSALKMASGDFVSEPPPPSAHEQIGKPSPFQPSQEQSQFFSAQEPVARTNHPDYDPRLSVPVGVPYRPGSNQKHFLSGDFVNPDVYSRPNSQEGLSGFTDGIRIGAENWKAQNLEDEFHNKLPLTAENYIRSVGGVVNNENIRLVENVLDDLVKQGLGSKTEKGYEILKKSRITKKIEDAPQSVFEVPSGIIGRLQELKDNSDRPAGFGALIFSLKEPTLTREQAVDLIQTSALIGVDIKSELLSLLKGVEHTSESSPSQEKEPRVLIAEAQTFDGLYDVLRGIRTIQGSSKLYDAEYLINTIEGIRRGGLEHTAMDITGTYGLRGKVIELLFLEKNKGEVAEEQLRTTKAVASTPKQQEAKFLEFGPMTKEQAEMNEVLREKVAEARKDFAIYEVEYKKKIWDGKGKFKKLMAELGVPEKQHPSIEKEQFHREAEEAYMEAKWNLKNFIAGRDVQKFKGSKMVFGEIASGARLIDVGLMDQAENEFRLLQKQILETTPLEEKGRIKKGLEVLARVPTYQKVILGSALTALAVGLVGGGGVTAAFAMFGTRIIRSTAGVGGALGTGKWIDGVKRKVDKDARADRFVDYGEKVGATREDFEKEEKENEQFFKDQEVYDKQIRLAKAATMALAGGLSAAGAGMVEGAVMDTFTTPGVKINPDINPKIKAVIPEGTKPKGSFMDKLIKKPSSFEPATTPKAVIPEKIIETPVEAKYTTPVEVDLSSKGFIDTVDQLKQATSGQKLTPALQRLLTQSPQKIAMDLGLYKPGQAAESAFGFQGEQLAIDAEGNVSLVHNSGATEVLMDSKGTLKPFTGKMFDADNLASSPYPSDATVVAPAGGSEAAFSGSESLDKVGEVRVASITADQPIGDPKWNNMFIGADSGSVKIELATTNPADLISGKVAIDPALQFNDGFKEYRRAYSVALERKLLDAPKDLFDYKLPVEYKGGRIYIFQKGKTLTALLNGEKIATGSIIDGKIGLQYENRLGTGLFGAKTEFEQAFKVAQEAIEKNKKAFNVVNT